MKNMSKEIYLQPKEKVTVKPNQALTIGDLCEILGEEAIIGQIKDISMLEDSYDRNLFIITLFSIMQEIKKRFPQIAIYVLGECDILIEVVDENEKSTLKSKFLGIFKITLVCFLLFIGGAVAIMNFHADVNMLEVQKNFYKFITGNEMENPLWIAIPYSLGIGIGMVLFFNHISPKKRKSNQPSPLDLELYSYQNMHDDFVRYQSKERNS